MSNARGSKREIVVEMEAEKAEKTQNQKQKDKGLCSHKFSDEDQAS